MSVPLFELGRCLITPGASPLFEEAGPSLATLLNRHATGDWGEVDEEDAAANRESIALGHRILSVYRIDSSWVYVITEADRSATTILLPDEY